MKRRYSGALALIIAFVISAFFIPQNVNAETIYNGIDVYEYSNITDYQALRNAGVSVIIQKASEGNSYNDKLLYYRASTAPKYGFKIGYYHFASNNGQPITQAQHFLSRIKGLQNDTVLWLDIEQPYIGRQWTRSEAINFTNQFIRYVQSQGYKIGVYTNNSFYYENLQGNIPNVPLWMASYGRQPDQFPERVSWQYTGTGYVNGVQGYADKDYFNSTIFGGYLPAPETSVTPVDNEIKQIQHNLNRVMNFGLAEDGIQGSQTTQAITEFQKIEGLATDGIAGTKTVSALNEILSFPTCKYGNRGYTTRYLQYLYQIGIDGVFGNQTVQATKTYQRSHGLSVDGIVGQATWKALFK
jgi:lysozyme